VEPADDDPDDLAAFQNLKPKFTDCYSNNSTNATVTDQSTRITFPLKNLA
jgi:hypothetical protein